jgi:hypothetical protein
MLGQSAQFGTQSYAPAPQAGSFSAAPPQAGSFSAGSYATPQAGSFAAQGSFGQDTFNLPTSGSFVAGRYDQSVGPLGPMGQFSNPFLAAMYSTLNGQTDHRSWPQHDVPNMPYAAAARTDVGYDQKFEAQFDSRPRDYSRDEGGDTAAEEFQKRTLEKEAKEKEEKKKRKKETHQASGFWFWTCS